MRVLRRAQCDLLQCPGSPLTGSTKEGCNEKVTDRMTYERSRMSAPRTYTACHAAQRK